MAEEKDRIGREATLQALKAFSYQTGFRLAQLKQIADLTRTLAPLYQAEFLAGFQENPFDQEVGALILRWRTRAAKGIDKLVQLLPRAGIPKAAAKCVDELSHASRDLQAIDVRYEPIPISDADYRVEPVLVRAGFAALPSFVRRVLPNALEALERSAEVLTGSLEIPLSDYLQLGLEINNLKLPALPEPAEMHPEVVKGWDALAPVRLREGGPATQQWMNKRRLNELLRNTSQRLTTLVPAFDQHNEVVEQIIATAHIPQIFAAWVSAEVGLQEFIRWHSYPPTARRDIWIYQQAQDGKDWKQIADLWNNKTDEERRVIAGYCFGSLGSKETVNAAKARGKAFSTPSELLF